ncbi:magnesium chelatase subunit ChlI family protein [Cupriavidus basilensis]
MQPHRCSRWLAASRDDALSWSARAYARVLKLARTIADLAGGRADRCGACGRGNSVSARGEGRLAFYALRLQPTWRVARGRRLKLRQSAALRKTALRQCSSACRRRNGSANAARADCGTVAAPARQAAHNRA